MRLFRRSAEGGELGDWQPRLYAILIILGLIVAWLVAFIVKNNGRVNIDFVLFRARPHLIWLILLLLAVGFLGGVLLSQVYRRRRRHTASKAEA